MNRIGATICNRHLLLALGFLLVGGLTACKKKHHALPKVPPPSWSVDQPEQYPVTMTAVVQVPQKLRKSLQATDQLAVFMDGVCRGTGTLVQRGEAAVFFVLIHGKAAEHHPLLFRYYAAGKKHLYATGAFLPFVADDNYGTVDVPRILDLKPAP